MTKKKKKKARDPRDRGQDRRKARTENIFLRHRDQTTYEQGRLTTRLPDGSLVSLHESPGGQQALSMPVEALQSPSWRDLPGSDMHVQALQHPDGRPGLACWRPDLENMYFENEDGAYLRGGDDDGPLAHLLQITGAVRIASTDEALDLPVTTGWTYRLHGRKYHSSSTEGNRYVSRLVLRSPKTATGPALYDGTAIAPRSWYEGLKEHRRLALVHIQSLEPARLWGCVAHPVLTRD